MFIDDEWITILVKIGHVATINQQFVNVRAAGIDDSIFHDGSLVDSFGNDSSNQRSVFSDIWGHAVRCSGLRPCRMVFYGEGAVA